MTDSVKISELPSGLANETVVVPGLQDGSLKQHTLPGAIFHSTATKEDVRNLANNTRQVTPANLGAVVTPIQNQLDNFWSSWLTPTVGSTGTKGAALNFDADATEVSSAADLPASPAAGDLITVDTTFTHSGVTYNAGAMYEWSATNSRWDLVPGFNALTAGQSTITQSLGSTNTAVFFDTATALPVIQGDTIRIGLIATNDAGQRLAIVEFNTAGTTVWKVISNAWVRITDGSDAAYLHDATGIKTGSGWYLTPLDGGNAPVTTPLRHWLVKRDSTQLVAHTVDATYASGALSTYDIHRSTRDFTSAAPVITGSGVKAALEGLSGDDRLDGSAVKNINADGSGTTFRFNVPGAAVEMPSSANSNVGDIIYVRQGFTHSNLGNANYAFYAGVFYKYSAAVGDDPAGWRPLNNSNRVFGQPGIAATDVTSNVFSPDRLGSGGAAGRVLTWKAGGQAWESLRSWEQIAGASNLTSGNAQSFDLTSGKSFADYDEVLFVQTDNDYFGMFAPLSLPRALFETTTSTNAVWYGSFHESYAAKLYWKDNTSYYLDATTHYTRMNVTSVWGR